MCEVFDGAEMCGLPRALSGAIGASLRENLGNVLEFIYQILEN